VLVAGLEGVAAAGSGADGFAAAGEGVEASAGDRSGVGVAGELFTGQVQGGGTGVLL
jgi:hypothetical protein